MIGYRKLAAAFMSIIASSLLAYLGSIDSGTYQVVMVATLGGFFASNAYKSTKETKTNE